MLVQVEHHAKRPPPFCWFLGSIRCCEPPPVPPYVVCIPSNGKSILQPHTSLSLEGFGFFLTQKDKKTFLLMFSLGNYLSSHIVKNSEITTALSPCPWCEDKEFLRLKAVKRSEQKLSQTLLGFFFWLDRAYIKEALKLELEFICISPWWGNEWARGERRRGRRTSVTGRGQKAEDKYEFRDGKGEQRRKRKTVFLPLHTHPC